MINLESQRNDLLACIDTAITQYANWDNKEIIHFKAGFTEYRISKENLGAFKICVIKHFPKRINDYKPYKFKPHKQIHRKHGKGLPCWVDLENFHDYIKLTGIKEDYWMFYYSYGRTPKMVESDYNWHNSGHRKYYEIDGFWGSDYEGIITPFYCYESRRGN